MASVKVAVRVRPMNQREKGLSSKSIIRVSGSTTYIQKPPHVRGEKVKERVKAFSFDFSYDSSDKESGAFANQEKVFNDLGSDVLKAAFEGFNTCVFAYGQTGSGKSFTMMGHTEDKGVIPRIGEGLFEEIAHKSKCETVSFRTEVSYLEIYNERVRDLLKRNKSPSEGGSLRVREHPKEGPYVENLSKHIIHNYSDMEVLIDLGNANRTTASTAMNDLSSRSHAIFTITFMQAWFDTDLPRETLSKIHLVDLAGSERADATRTTGTRLKEGANINKSLVTLGSVISTLADLSTAEQSTKTKQVFIPYRDSVLTWLLKDSLGGNSKTTMIATVSPADVNYTETLSTLRYASRAKNIVNAPTVNEDDSVKIIRELQAEVTRLQRLLDEASQTPSRELPSSVTVEKELHQNEAKVLALTKEWTSKWTETQTILQGDALALRKDGSGVVLDCQLPHFIGIGKDLLSTGIILYYLKEGWTQMGSDKTQDIVLQGPELLGEHCVVENCAGAVTLIPQDGALCSVNGSVVTDRCQLTQGNIIQLGSGTMLRFNHPSEAAQLREKRQNGLMSAFSLSLTDLSKSTENLSKVMLQNPGIVEDKEKCNHQEEPRQQYQVNLARSTLDKKRQKEDGEVPSEKKEEKMTGALVGETGNGLLAAVSEVQCSAASTELRTTAIGGKHPVALTSFKADEDKIEGGVSTREVYNQERDSCHKSRLRLMSERLWRKAQNGATVPSYQKEEVWSGDASLQQTSVLGLGYGCSSKPEGNANEIQGVVADCYKGRPGSGGSSLGSVSHLQSGGGTSSMSVLPQTGTQSQMDRMPLSSQAPCRTPEQTVFEGQVCCGETNESGHLKEVPGANMTETEEAAATGQRSALGLFVHRVSWIVQDAGRLLLSPSTILQTFRNEGLQPFGVYHAMSLVQESKVASLVKNSHVFSMVKRSFVFSLWRDNHTFSTVEEPLPMQHIQSEATQSPQPGATNMSPGGFCPSSTKLPNVSTQTLSKAEELSCNKPRMPSISTNNLMNLSNKQDMALIHIKQEDTSVTEKDVSKEIVQVLEKSTTKSDLFVSQVLIQFPESLSHLQTLPLQDILNVLNSIISTTLITTQNIVALFWLNVAKCSQPDPCPALLIMAETGLYTLTTDSKTLTLFHYLPLLQLKEINIALAGQSLRLMGTTEDSILGVYTHSQKITKELCVVILGAICPGDNRISQHPLLHGDLMKMSLDCQVYVPDLLMDAGLRVCSQFHRSLADLIYLLHCNMDHTGIPLGDIHILLYFSVAACISPDSHSESLMQLFLTDTSFGLVQVDTVFHPTLCCVTLQPYRPLFCNLTLRQRSDVRCVLLHDEDERGAVRLDVILVNTKGRGHSESVSIATSPPAKASNSAPLAEVWKLTFSCSSEAAFLINHLSNV